ncbi:hypothetical protein BaRGS_00025095 [Batillaria attramentaria]|uniref:Pre-rRNA-processing protein TSR1 homolog n=1 Tax=Batillaria attramentaria TaxID=370345 RepID=A0ABD0K9E3_9CAEN
MAEDSEHRHRPGAMKQQNKGHKHGRHRTKGQIDRDNQGRVNVKTISKKSTQYKKAERRNLAQQIRKQKRDEALNKKRQRGGVSTPPLFVVVIPLCGEEHSQNALELLQTAAAEMEGGEGQSTASQNEQGILHLSVPRFRKRISFYTPPAESLHAVLDAAKVADNVMFIMSPHTELDERTEFLFSCLMGQGMPSATFVYHGMATLPVKKVADTKKALQKVFENRFPDAKLHALDKTQDAQVVLRHLTDGKLKSVHYREKRPHLVAENISFEAESAEATVGTMKVSGYLRGAAMSVNRLVYLVGGDTYQLLQIDSVPDPHPLVLKPGKQRTHGKGGVDVEMDDTSVTVLAKADPQKQESLQSEVEPDPMEGEQTWPTEEELAEAENNLPRKKKLPKGFSEYQSAWIVSDDEEDDNSGDDEDEDMAPVEQSESESSEEDEDDEEEGYEAMMTEGEDTDKLEKMKDERQHVMFPDEVDTPHDLPARERFARYRGLQSFRTSPWHKDEELPPDYARIYRFSNLKLLQKEILKREDPDAVQPGQYITVHVANVPKSFMENYKPGEPVVLFGMLPYEQCMSVIHFVIRRTAGFTQTIRSKDRLVFQVGYRRFSACPIFSQHTSGDKQKFERYLPQEGAVVATMFAPIMFGPAPVLVFTPGQDQLVATGSLLSDNPDRIIIKRVVLSGAPFKINKRTATIRFMFFNRDDILWFKKIELRTKWGRRGRILEPLGTHGHMKCYFNTQLKSQDTVLMNLYKRQFPKWTYSPSVPTPMPLSRADEELEGAAYQMFD